MESKESMHIFISKIMSFSVILYFVILVEESSHNFHDSLTLEVFHHLKVGVKAYGLQNLLTIRRTVSCNIED